MNRNIFFKPQIFHITKPLFINLQPHSLLSSPSPQTHLSFSLLYTCSPFIHACSYRSISFIDIMLKQKASTNLIDKIWSQIYKQVSSFQDWYLHEERLLPSRFSECLFLKYLLQKLLFSHIKFIIFTVLFHTSMCPDYQR